MSARVMPAQGGNGVQRRQEMEVPGMGAILFSALVHAVMCIVIAWLVTEAAIEIAQIIWA